MTGNGIESPAGAARRRCHIPGGLFSVCAAPPVRWLLRGLLVLALCGGAPAGVAPADCPPGPANGDFRQAMRDLVIALSTYAKNVRPGFAVIPQNGLELVTQTGDPQGAPAKAYLEAIDGIVQESLFFGQPAVDSPTPGEETAYLLQFADRVKSMGKAVLVIDYCQSPPLVEASYRRNTARGYIGYAADRRELDRIAAHPPLAFAAHPQPVTTLSQTRNFVYLINTGPFAGREAFFTALQAAAFDVVVVDLFFNDRRVLTPEEVRRLQHKAGGARRLVAAYMSIGEAEAYRAYWKPVWDQFPPSWMAEQNPHWPGNYKVQYWAAAWQKILFGTPEAYLDQILAAGFDGVVLDIIDAFQYFEQRAPSDDP
jgi:cysteinyl-tRNA synthetase